MTGELYLLPLKPFKAGWTILLLQLWTSAFKLWSVNLSNSYKLFQRHHSWAMQLLSGTIGTKIQLLKGFLKGPIFFVVLQLNSRELVDKVQSHKGQWPLIPHAPQKGSHDPPANPNRSSAAAPVGPGDLKCPRHDGNCLVLPEAMTPKISKMGFLWFSFYWSIRINFFSM